MKILVFADVHGNLNKLEELSRTDDFISADIRIFLGDIVVGVDYPNECIELIKKLDCLCLLGNNDSYVCDHIPQEELSVFSAERIQKLIYNQKKVKQENKNAIMNWPKEYTIDMNNKKLYFTHYPWESEDNVIDAPKEKTLKERQKMFMGKENDYIFFAHEHKANNFIDDKTSYYCLAPLGINDLGYYVMVSIENEKIEIKEKTL